MGERSLAEAIERFVEPGDHLHFASMPFRSNAALLQVAARFHRTDSRFRISASGFHSSAHLLPALGLGSSYVACFFGDNHPTPRPSPLYDRLDREGRLELTSLLGYVEALRAGALGHPFGVTRSLVGSDLGRDLERAGGVRFADGPDGPVALVTPLVPDVCFVHGAVGDRAGNVVLPRPLSEGPWGALAARRGVVATVERLVDDVSCARDALPIPAHRVLAVCEVPFGAHPQPQLAAPAFGVRGYADDPLHYARWREIAAVPEALGRFVDEVLDLPDPWSAYVAWVGQERLHGLTDQQVDPTPDPPEDALLEHAVAHLVERVDALGAPVLLAGIGQSFQACRRARERLAARGRSVDVDVEIGVHGLSDAPGSPFLLAREHLERAGRVTDVEDVLGAIVCGRHTRSIGVVGAAEVDPTGALNSTRLPGRFLVGSGGANDIGSSAHEVVVLARSDRLVPRVHHRTTPGHRVRAVVTERGVLVRTGPDAPWRGPAGLSFPSQEAPCSP